MTTQPPEVPMFWVKDGDVPRGPFDAAAIRAKLAAGEIGPQAMLCLVGGEDWRSLEQCGFTADVAESDVSSTRESEASKPRPVMTGSPSPAPGIGDYLLGLAVLGVAGAGVIWLISYLFAPLTPRQVVEKLNAATSYKQGERWLTLNMRPAYRALEHLLKEPDAPDDRFELTVDRPAPPEIGGHFVGYRFQSKDPVTKRQEQLDGFFHLIESDGWKVDDLIITAQNHQPLDEPLSLARDYRLLLTGNGWSASKRTGSNTISEWIEPKLTRPYTYGLSRLLGGAIIAIIAGTAAWVASLRKRATNSQDKSSKQ